MTTAVSSPYDPMAVSFATPSAASSSSLAPPLHAGSSSSMQRTNGVPYAGQSFTIGTRNSKLAMVQAIGVKAELEKRFPGLDVKIVGMTTGGDQNQTKPLYLIGGKALWTKELEIALVDGRVDAIVHCLKDIPTDFPEGCELGAICTREDPSDALVVRAGLNYKSLDDLPDGSVIGTSSVRRVAQLRRKYPNLRFADVRGNVITRLRKLDDPALGFTALVLATAGLIRLGLSDRITTTVKSPILYHAVGQGALALEVRERDPRSLAFVQSLEDWRTGWATRAERSMLRMLEGGCSVPVGCETYLVQEVDAALCPVVGANGVKKGTSGVVVEIDEHLAPNAISDGLPPHHPKPRRFSDASGHSVAEDVLDDPTKRAARLTLTGTITSLSGKSAVIANETRVVRSVADAEKLGADMAARLIAQGGRAILEELGRHVKEVGEDKDLDGKELPFEPGSPKRPLTVFKEGEMCLRPVGW